MAARLLVCCWVFALAPSRAAGLGVTWYAPFFSGGGYCSEATAFVIELAKRAPLRIVQHGDGYNDQYMGGLPPATVAALQHVRPSASVCLHCVPLCPSVCPLCVLCVSSVPF